MKMFSSIRTLLKLHQLGILTDQRLVEALQTLAHPVTVEDN
jgi:hypothetical protein